MTYIQNLLYWWYVIKPAAFLKILPRLQIILDDRLSLSLLFKTFFVPWHRDDSAVGYFMGIMMRLLYLPLGFLLYLITLLLYVIFILLWILAPVLGIFLLILIIF